MLSISAFALLAAAQPAPEEKPPPVAPPPIIRSVPTPPPPILRIIPSPPLPPPPRAPTQVMPARPRATLASYVSVDDYPAEALFNEEEGVVAFRLLVATNGRVADCIVTSSSGSPSLDETSCRIMRTRARFTPARDSYGNLTEDTVSQRIRWQLADEEPPAPSEPGSSEPADVSEPDPFPAQRARPVAPLALLAREEVLAARSAGRSGTTHFELRINPDGRVGECVVRTSSGSPELDASACRIVGTARFTPPRDANGNPAADRHRGHIDWANPAPLPVPPPITPVRTNN